MKKIFHPVRIPPDVFSSLLNDLRDAAAKGGMCQNLRERLNRTLQGYVIPDHPHTRPAEVEDLLTPEQREAFDLLQESRQQKEMEWLAANQNAKDIMGAIAWQARASNKAESIELTNIKRANTMKQVLASKEEDMTRVRDDLNINVPEKMKVLCIHCCDDYADENLCLGVCCGSPMVQVSYLLYHTRLREGWTKDLMAAWAKQNGKPL